jgi:2-hydroxychromene-2-carboxylate isomerase
MSQDLGRERGHDVEETPERRWVRDDLQTPQSPPQFFFGAMSPYSWLAAERIEQLLPSARWRGVLAGAIFKANGRVSWGLTERREESISDCEARAAEYGLGPIDWPRTWPTSDLSIARAMVYAERARRTSSPAPAIGASPAADSDGGVLKTFALKAMRMAFLEGADLGELDVVLEVGRRTGIDASRMRDALQAPETKDALRQITDEALALGVFGVPTVAVAGELFWGDDRLEDAAAAQRSLSVS